jgi:hypothetical protein
VHPVVPDWGGAPVRADDSDPAGPRVVRA